MNAGAAPGWANYADVPLTLRAEKRWLVWKRVPYIDPAKKPRKVPYYTNGRRRGQTDTDLDREQLAMFEEAVAALRTGWYDGLGFALGPDGNGGCWQGIDFDHIDQHPELQDVRDEVPGYTEASPSGNGLHAIGYGASFDTLGSNDSGIEAYCRGRYLTVTGEGAGLGDVADLASFVDTVLRPRHARHHAGAEQRADGRDAEDVPDETIADLRSALASLRADDRNRWVKMAQCLACLRERGRALWMEWSQTSDKYDPADAARVWDSVTGDRAGYRGVFAEAQRHGWVNPAKGREYDVNFGTGDRAKDRDTTGGGGNRHGLHFRQVAELDMRAPEWLVRHLVECGAFGVGFGDPESGKSLFAFDLSLSIASGVAFHGYKVKQGPVLYLAGEGQRGIARRAAAWAKRRCVDLHTVPFYVSTVPTALTDKAAQVALGKAVARFAAENGQPVLIVLDTLARNFGGGDENSTGDMGIAVQACDALRDATDATILVLHHSGHGDKTRARGSIALRGAADFEYAFTADDGTVTVTCAKCKDGASPAPLAFRIERVELDGLRDDEGEPVTSVVLVSTTYAGPQRKTTAGAGKNQKLALNILRERYAQNRATLAKGGFDPAGAVVSLKDWRLLCAARGINRSRFGEVSRSLELTGDVRIDNGNVFLCEACETGANRTDSHAEDEP